MKISEEDAMRIVAAGDGEFIVFSKDAHHKRFLVVKQEVAVRLEETERLNAYARRRSEGKG